MKYQLVISSDSLEELQQVTFKIQSSTSGTAGVAVGSPQASTAVVQVASAEPLTGEEEDDGDEAPIDPSAIFGSTPPAFSPNSGATAAPLTPSQPVPSAASTTAVGAELDSRGFPWDGRIHAGSRARLAKNNAWKPLRGVDPAIVAAVEAELVAQGYGGGAEEVQAAPVIAPVVTAAPVAPVLPGLPTLPTPSAPTGPTPASVKERFTRALSQQRVDAPWILQVLQFYGVANLDALSQHADKVTTINDYLDTVIKDIQ